MRSSRRAFHPWHRRVAVRAALLSSLLFASGCAAIDKIYDTEFSTTIHLFGAPATQPDSRPASGASSAPLVPQTAPNLRS